MEGVVRSWTQVERPPAGFPAGRVIALVECADGARRYALWEGPGSPPVEGVVRLEPRGGTWMLRSP